MERFAVLALVVVAIACSPAPSDVPSASTSESGLHATGRSLARLEGPCGEADRPQCVEVDLTWPEFDGQGESAIALNLFARGQVTSAMTLGDTEFDTPESATDDFVGAYLDFIAEYPDSPQSWFARSHGDVIHQSASTVTLRFDTETFTGGAHGLQWSTLASFDSGTGRRLALEDLVSDADGATALAEQAFRKAHELGSGDDLEEAGFWFDDNLFSLPEDVALTADGLLIYWPPYEIGPYAMGPTELVLHRADLRELLIRE